MQSVHSSSVVPYGSPKDPSWRTSGWTPRDRWSSVYPEGSRQKGFNNQDINKSNNETDHDRVNSCNVKIWFRLLENDTMRLKTIPVLINFLSPLLNTINIWMKLYILTTLHFSNIEPLTSSMCVSCWARMKGSSHTFSMSLRWAEPCLLFSEAGRSCATALSAATASSYWPRADRRFIRRWVICCMARQEYCKHSTSTAHT